ncbi:hypothetical protein HN014_10760 [Aquimarina sp. TRL1]|uniref:hypothetical protein n=1 Tax=Aquimarina sp. (strain TRL1) TaxID=2736252 RepID=UPI00158CF0E8|nr:hypothetical protein [Aquimarina sp. TRL1]QKX05374.1 hypothetical protein HN014_10760 [Aquimarina sp. TRL1]
MAVQKKRKLVNYLDALVDKDGLKTEVTITLTDQTMTRIIISFLVSGIAIVAISHLIKNYFPNMQLGAIQRELIDIKKQLK